MTVCGCLDAEERCNMTDTLFYIIITHLTMQCGYRRFYLILLFCCIRRFDSGTCIAAVLS